MNITNIFTDFFNCLTIPTLVLNDNFKTICTYKSDSSLINSFYTPKAIDKLKNYKFNPGILNIDLNNSIKYSCIMFFHCNNIKMYILIGPYILKDDINTKSDILCINSSTLNNVINFYSFIIDKHISSHKIVKNNSPCVTRAIDYIEKNYTSEISIDDLCMELNINKCYFCSVFKKETGSTFINYLNSYKVEKSKELLKNTTLSLLDIALSVGFNNQSYYSTVFKKITSQTPLEFRDAISINQKITLKSV